MTTPNEQPRKDPPENPVAMTEEQLAAELRAAMQSEPDPQSRKRLERIADEVHASLRAASPDGKNGNPSRGNSAA